MPQQNHAANAKDAIKILLKNELLYVEKANIKPVIEAKDADGKYKYTARSIAFVLAYKDEGFVKKMLRELFFIGLNLKEGIDNTKTESCELSTRIENIIAYLANFLDLDREYFSRLMGVNPRHMRVVIGIYKEKKILTEYLSTKLSVKIDVLREHLTACYNYTVIHESDDSLRPQQITKLKPYIKELRYINISRPGLQLILIMIKEEMKQDASLAVVAMIHLLGHFSGVPFEISKSLFRAMLLENGNEWIADTFKIFLDPVLDVLKKQGAPEYYKKTIVGIQNLCIKISSDNQDRDSYCSNEFNQFVKNLTSLNHSIIDLSGQTSSDNNEECLEDSNVIVISDCDEDAHCSENAIKSYINHNELLYIRLDKNVNIIDVIKAKNDNGGYEYTARSIALVSRRLSNKRKNILTSMIIKAMELKKELELEIDEINGSQLAELLARIRNIIAYMVYFLNMDNIIEKIFWVDPDDKTKISEQIKEWLQSDGIAQNITFNDLKLFQDECNQDMFKIEQEDVLNTRVQIEKLKICIQQINHINDSRITLASMLSNIKATVQGDKALMTVVMTQFLMCSIEIKDNKNVNNNLHSLIVTSGNIWISCEITELIPSMLELMAKQAVPEKLSKRLKYIDNVCKNPWGYDKGLKDKPALYAKRTSDFFIARILYKKGRMVSIDLINYIQINYFRKVVFFNVRKFNKAIEIIKAKDEGGSFKYTARSIAMTVACMAKVVRNVFLRRLIGRIIAHKKNEAYKMEFELFDRCKNIIAYMIFFLDLQGNLSQILPSGFFDSRFWYRDFEKRVMPSGVVGLIDKDDFAAFISECGRYEIPEKNNESEKNKMEKLKAYVHIICNLSKPGSPKYLLEKFKRDLVEDPQLIVIVMAYFFVSLGRLVAEMSELKKRFGEELIKDENTDLRVLILRHCSYVIEELEAQQAPKIYSTRIREIISVCLIPESYCTKYNNVTPLCTDLTDNSQVASKSDAANAKQLNRKRKHKAQRSHTAQKRVRRTRLFEMRPSLPVVANRLDNISLSEEEVSSDDSGDSSLDPFNNMASFPNSQDSSIRWNHPVLDRNRQPMVEDDALFAGLNNSALENYEQNNEPYLDRVDHSGDLRFAENDASGYFYNNDHLLAEDDLNNGVDFNLNSPGITPLDNSGYRFDESNFPSDSHRLWHVGADNSRLGAINQSDGAQLSDELRDFLFP